MQVSRILPDLQCSLLSDDIRQQSDGNFIIIGIYSHFVVPQVPVVALQVCLDVCPVPKYMMPRGL